MCGGDFSLNDDIYTVSEISEAIKQNLQTEFPNITIIGEVANFKAHTSGHFYFSLRDENNLLRVVVFRRDTMNIAFSVENGTMILVSGRISHYGGGGQTQLIGKRFELAGKGELEVQFRKLLKKLVDRGLTDPVRKKQIPEYPHKIAVITSPTGAVIKDITETLARRWPVADILHLCVDVQGPRAVESITRAFDMTNNISDVDVIILGRGGGSIEDLWTFNNERLAEAISSSIHPVITGIGHEIDNTIADYVSDVRAGTPTAAAELATPLKEEVDRNLADIMNKLSKTARQSSERMFSSLEYLMRSSVFPAINYRLESLELRLDDRITKIKSMWEKFKIEKYNTIRYYDFYSNKPLGIKLRKSEYEYGLVLKKMSNLNPRAEISAYMERLKRIGNMINARIKGNIKVKYREISGIMRTLDDLYPFKVLKRGYTFCTDDTGNIVGTVRDVSIGENMNVNFHDGIAGCRVKNKGKGPIWRKK